MRELSVIERDLLLRASIVDGQSRRWSIPQGGRISVPIHPQRLSASRDPEIERI